MRENFINIAFSVDQKIAFKGLSNLYLRSINAIIDNSTDLPDNAGFFKIMKPQCFKQRKY